MITCYHCHQENRPTAFYCKQCGHAIACPRCRILLREAASFCDNCSQPLAGERGVDVVPHPEIRQSVDAVAEVSTTPAAASPVSQPAPGDGDSYLEQFVPSELRAKLDAARAGDAMAGERRVVTMLFCDVKGSTAAAENLDPEEWTEIINGAFEHMIRPVYKYEGTVARLMGDGILAFFGAPIAHEDDPQRAVLAGLAIVDSITLYREQVKQQHEVDLDVRVGINTGMVVVGTVGSDLRMEYTAMGDAINLAARMEQTAEPGTVQIAHDTYKIVKPLFEFMELGEIQVKGKDSAVLAYRVLGRKTTAGRLRGIEGLQSALVGRQREVELLNELLADVQHGIGRIVCVIGDAGLGKSRLISEVKLSDNVQGLEWFETASLSYETSQPYALFHRLTRRLNDINPGDSRQSVHEKLAPLLARCSETDRQRVARVLDALFNLGSSNGEPPLQGETFKRELFQVMPMLWQERFAQQPAVIVFDDIHWSDPASIELLLTLFPIIDEVPLLLLCAFRPDREAPVWRIKTTADEEFHHRYTEILLRPLAAPQVNEQVDQLLAVADLPAELRQRIQQQSGGNPFFVEEVVRSLIDSGAVVPEDRQEDGETQRHWRATGDGAEIEIPDSLHALLVARIDRLEEETRQVLQLASVIGRSFYRRVLQAIQAQENGEGRDVHRALNLLLRLEMIREAARLPELEYRFSNPLTQEVAYQSILRKRRREFHLRVGEAMELLFPEQLAELAPQLAFHFREGGQDDQAVKYFTQAGDAAYRLYALREAVEHYSQALALCDLLTADSGQLIHLYRHRGRALELDNAYADALENYDEMARLAEQRQDDSLKLASLLARTIVHSTYTPVFDPDAGLPLAEEALALARQIGDHAAEARVLWSLMLVHAFSRGDMATGIRFGQQSLSLARQHELEELLPYVLNDLGRVLGLNGQIHQGLPLIAEATPLFVESGNLPLLSDNLNGYSLIAYYAGNMLDSRQAAEEALRVSRSINNQVGMRDSTLRANQIYGEQGELGRAIAGIEAELKQAGDKHPYALPFLGHLYAELGSVDSILPRLEAHLDQFAGMGYSLQFHTAQLIRLYVRQGDLVAAEQMRQQLTLEPSQSKLLPTNVWSFLAYAELAFARGEYEQVVTLLDRLQEEQEATGLGLFAGDLALIRARALLALSPSRPEQAQAVLQNAIAAAREHDHRRILWRLLLVQVDLVDTEQASVLRKEAREIVDWIAAEIQQPELREAFLSQPVVRSLAREG